MRICFLTSDLSWYGGTTKMTAYLSTLLSQQHDVSIISLHFDEGKCFFPVASDVKQIVLPRFSGKTAIMKQIHWLHKHLKTACPHWLINVDMGMGFYGILAAKGTETKVITWEHGNYHNNWGSRLFPYMRRYAAKKSDAVVLLTQKDKQNYLEHIPRHAPVTVIPNPATSHNHPYNLMSRTILSVGHLLENKGYHRVIEVGKMILPSRPEWKWVICGEGPERGRLEASIKEAGLEGQILLPGLIKDMDSQYKNAAIQVLTSDMEGLPMTLLEGKGWGLPLVAFDIMTGPSDIIDHDTNGYLIEAFDLEVMANKISMLMDNDDLRQQFSNHANLGMSRFSEESILGAWQRLLQGEE